MAWSKESETSGSWSPEGPEASQAITDSGVAVTDSGIAVVIDSRFVGSAVWIDYGDLHNRPEPD